MYLLHLELHKHTDIDRGSLTMYTHTCPLVHCLLIRRPAVAGTWWLAVIPPAAVLVPVVGQLRHRPSPATLAAVSRYGQRQSMMVALSIENYLFIVKNTSKAKISVKPTLWKTLSNGQQKQNMQGRQWSGYLQTQVASHHKHSVRL